MVTARSALWLEVPGGTSFPIKPDGVLIGRAPHCDVVVTDPGASRAQAIVFAGASGPCLTVLGKGATAVNGEAVTRDRDLDAGDRIELPGLALTVVAGAPTPPPSTWVVRAPGGLFGVVRTPFTVGGDAHADLRFDGWPGQVLRFHLADRLHVEALVPITVRGRDLEPGEVEVLGPGDAIGYGSVAFEVVAGGALGQGTTAGDGDASSGPERVRLEFMARGGRLTVAWAGRERTVYLPERRCDLIATLLQPPEPFRPGDDIPDDMVLPRVWPGRSMTRVDLNVLLHRARHDLVRAELDGAALLPRADGGNATRFALSRGAVVTIE